MFEFDVLFLVIFIDCEHALNRGVEEIEEKGKM